MSNVLQEQRHDTDREALEQERKRRRELERRLTEEMAKHNEIMEQTIKLRDKQKIQASLKNIFCEITLRGTEQAEYEFMSTIVFAVCLLS